MAEKRTYSVKFRIEQDFGYKHSNMADTIRKSREFLNDYGPSKDENWTEIEVIDNLTEISVFKERKVK